MKVINRIWRKVGWTGVVVGLVIVIAGVFRLFDLGAKTLHHDESIHAYYSWILFKDGLYQYNPLSHGPLLYYLISICYHIFGVSDAAARVAPAIFGIMLVPTVLLLKPYLKKPTLIFLMLLIATSPMLVYVSRFARHDMISLFFTALIMFSTVRYITKPSPVWVYTIILSFAFSYVNHELTYLTGLFWLISLVMVFISVPDRKKYWRIFVDRDMWHMLLALSLAVLVISLFYSSFASFPEGLKLALPNPKNPNSALGYWIAQHGVERAGQPFHFYILELALYDILPLILGTYYMLSGLKKVRYGFVMAFLVFAFMILTYDKINIIGELKIGDGVIATAFAHIPQLLLFVLVIVCSFGQKDTTKRFLVCFAGLTLLAYSIAGEKMPWLTVHPLLPLIVLSGFAFQDIAYALNGKVHKAFMLSILILIGWSAFNAYRLAYVNYENPKELAVYVQSQAGIKAAANEYRNKNDSFKIAVGNDLAWPFVWYFRNIPYNLVNDLNQGDMPDVAMLSTDEYSANPGALLSTYSNVNQQPMRSWWVPTVGWPGFKPLAKYYFAREPWSDLGSYDFVTLTGKR